MKKTLKTILALLTAWVILSISFYAGGSFMNSSFDIKKWDTVIRETIGGIWIALSIFFMVAVSAFFMAINEPDKKP